jgi:hypothetical protein
MANRSSSGIRLSAPSSGEALGADELVVQELLEDLGVRELRQDAELLVASERMWFRVPLHPSLEPRP